MGDPLQNITANTTVSLLTGLKLKESFSRIYRLKFIKGFFSDVFCPANLRLCREMGCGNSSETEGRKEEEHGFFHRRPKVSIRVGQHVEEVSKDETLVVFVFGGPGSKKGRIVDDLVHMYGFRALIAEDLILKELPKKVQNVMAIESTKGLAEMLKDNQSLLSLEWILELIGNEIEKDAKRPHIVDIMPNLRFLLRCEKYIQEPEYDMKNFEKRFPNIFALNLAIPEEKVIKQITAHSAKHPDKMKEAGQSDEADTSRTQRRNALYTSSVKHFLHYFTNMGRLVTVDVACGVADLIWHRVSDFFGHQLELEPVRTVNTVVIFAFGKTLDEACKLNYSACKKVT